MIGGARGGHRLHRHPSGTRTRSATPRWRLRRVGTPITRALLERPGTRRGGRRTEIPRPAGPARTDRTPPSRSRTSRTPASCREADRHVADDSCALLCRHDRALTDSGPVLRPQGLDAHESLCAGCQLVLVDQHDAAVVHGGLAHPQHAEVERRAVVAADGGLPAPSVGGQQPKPRGQSEPIDDAHPAKMRLRACSTGSA